MTGLALPDLVLHVKAHLAASTDWDHLSDADVNALVGLTVHALWDAGAIMSPEQFDAILERRVEAEVDRRYANLTAAFKGRVMSATELDGIAKRATPHKAGSLDDDEPSRLMHRERWTLANPPTGATVDSAELSEWEEWRRRHSVVKPAPYLAPAMRDAALRAELDRTFLGQCGKLREAVETFAGASWALVKPTVDRWCDRIVTWLDA